MTDWIKILKDNYNELVKAGMKISELGFDDWDYKFVVEIDNDGNIRAIEKENFYDYSMSWAVCFGSSIEAYRMGEGFSCFDENYDKEYVEEMIKEEIDNTIKIISDCNKEDKLAVYRTYWSAGFYKDNPCVVNTKTKEAYNIYGDDIGLLDEDLLDEESIIIDGEEYPIGYESTEEKHENYWYRDRIWDDEAYSDNYYYNDNDEYIWRETGEVAEWLYDSMCLTPSEKKEIKKLEENKKCS